MQSMQMGQLPGMNGMAPMMMPNLPDMRNMMNLGVQAMPQQAYPGYGLNPYAQAAGTITGSPPGKPQQNMHRMNPQGGYMGYGQMHNGQPVPASPEQRVGQKNSGGSSKKGTPKTQPAKRAAINHPSDDDNENADDANFRHAPPADMHCPCKHNDWDDVRTRKGAKILRCRVCQSKWKLPSARVPRCSPFLSGHCERGNGCPLVHVHKRKSNLLERYEKFGDSVLRGVPTETWEKATKDDESAAPSGSANISPEHKSFQTPTVTCGDEAYLPPEHQQFLPPPQQAMEVSAYPAPPISPTGMGRRGSSQSMGVPSLLSTESVTRSMATQSMHGGNFRIESQAGSPHHKHASPPSLICSPSSAHPASGVPSPSSRSPLAGRRTFRPPQLNTGAGAPEGAHAQGVPALASQCPSVDIHMSLNDSRIRGLLPSDLLSPAGAGDQRGGTSPVHLAGVPKVDSMMMARAHMQNSPHGRVGCSPTHSPYADEQEGTRKMYMRQQLHAAAEAAQKPGAKPEQTNEGVHAMTDAELDAHMERLGMSPTSSVRKTPASTPKAVAKPPAVPKEQ
eukprot:TRINITY_DN5436_c0_g3_i1.p1 TRINITY_DN5436_c0_g3~~TRINITY_DN5436_c0_g3_i1.p1  ORF type:complete len:563 (+),score=193.40 TRINITY_DN5436_c0_g3_i1:64-1752(+)